MIEVYPNLYVGNQDDYEGLPDKKDWAILHACKEPYHRKALGYTSQGAPKDSPEYLWALRGNELSLNLVDAKDPAYIPKEVMDRGVQFIAENIARRKVLVHCNRGESRGPSIALLYLRRNTNKFSGVYEDEKKKFSEVYSEYNPGIGVESFVRSNWGNGVKETLSTETKKEQVEKIPPETLEIIKKQLSALSTEELQSTRFQARAAIARENNNPYGFGHFFWCINGHELAPYAEKVWVPEIYAAKAENTGVLNEAFRGSTKSTVGYTLDLFLLGHNPHKSGLIVGANDDAANKISSLVAAVIEFLPGWKATFPHVVPDKDRGWGAKGYQIKDTRIPYDKWVEKTVQDHGRDNSFVGAGVESSDIPGMHPSLFLHIDDIHDEKNTSSPRELAAVKAAVRKNILPTMSRPGPRPFYHVEFTPWVKDDAYQIMVDTNIFRHIKTPLYTEVAMDEPGAVLYQEKYVKFADWPGHVNAEFADFWRSLLNDRSTFFLMMLLDREGAIRERIFKWYPYKSELVNFGWPLVAGADYASVYQPTRGNPGDRSHFALCYALKTPEGNVVIGDGVVEQCTQLQAENYVMSAQSLYQGWLNVVVEMDGKGSDFFQLMARHPGMNAIPKWTGGKKKPDRLWKGMSGWFELGKVRISDADTKFLNLARAFLNNYPNISQHAPEWDVADSIYYALLGMPDVLQVPSIGNELPGTQKKPIHNPWAAAGRIVG